MRDGKTGFTFFNIEGHQYDYDPNAQSLSITGGHLLVSQEFANALGRPSECDSAVGKISIGARMQPIEIQQLVNGEPKSIVMPPLQGNADARNEHPGPMLLSEIYQTWSNSAVPARRSVSRSQQLLVIMATSPSDWFAVAAYGSPSRSAKSLSDERRGR